MEGGVVEELCMPDTLSPAQFQELWSGVPERSAEFKLALAVLEQALDDFEKHRQACSNEAQRLYRHAHTWILSNDRRWPYSFVNVCEMLNVCAERIRTHVLAAPDGDIAPRRTLHVVEDLATVTCGGNA